MISLDYQSFLLDIKIMDISNVKVFIYNIFSAGKEFYSEKRKLTFQNLILYRSLQVCVNNYSDNCPASSSDCKPVAY